MEKVDQILLRVNPGGAYDVVVIGGGPGGSMAAIAAAREGMRTLLVEQYAFLGGSLTAMGVGPMMTFHNKAGRQLIYGLPQELVDRLVARGASPGHIVDSTGYCSTVTPFDSEALKITLEQMATEAGVEMLFHTRLVDVVSQEDRITRIIVSNKAGLTACTARVFVDASGDGDLSARAGVKFSLGREADGLAQPMTMNLKVANVDTARLRRYVLENPDDFDHGTVQKLQAASRISLGGFVKEWNAAKSRGEIDVPRHHVLFFETGTPGVFIVNTSRIIGLDATDPGDLTRAEMIGRRQTAQIFDFLVKYCPGFEQAVRVDSAAQVGVRESRHIQGMHTLQAQELLAGVEFPDPIALGGYHIDIHAVDGGQMEHTYMPDDIAYQIPMRCLLTDSVANLVISGRCISATHEAAAAIRTTPSVMAIGQAAGTIAAVAVRSECPANRVAYADVRAVLLANGALI